jgi:putative endonuclease
MCFVYIIGCISRYGRRTYVGWTTDLDRRLGEHNAGTGARSTRGYDWVLLYAERYATRGEAMRREWRLKRDRRFRKSLIVQFEAERTAAETQVYSLPRAVTSARPPSRSAGVP